MSLIHGPILVSHGSILQLLKSATGPGASLLRVSLVSSQFRGKRSWGLIFFMIIACFSNFKSCI